MGSLPMVITPEVNTEEIKKQLMMFNNITININAEMNAENVKNETEKVKKSTQDILGELGKSLGNVGSSIKGIWNSTLGLGKSIGEIMGSYSSGNEIDELKSKYSELKETIFKKFEGPLKKAVETGITCIDTLTKSISDGELSGGIEKIAEGFGSVVDKVCDFVIELLPKIIDGIKWLLDNSSTIIPIIAAIGAAVETIKVVGVVNEIIGSVKKLSSVTNVVKTGIGMLGGPTTLIIAGIAALIAGVITFWNTNEDFRNAVIGIWENIKEVAEVVWGALVTFFTETIPEAWQAVIDFFTGIPDWFTQLWETIKQAFFDGWQAVVDFFTETVPQWIESIVEWFNQLPEMIGYALGFLLANIVQFGLNCWEWITVELPLIIQGIIDWFASLPERVWEWLVNTFNYILQWASDVYNTSMEWIGNTVSSIINWFSQLPGMIWEWLCNAVSNIVQWGSDMISRGAEAASSLVTSIVDIISSLPGKMIDIGTNIVQGIWDGISNMGNWIKNKVLGFCDGLFSGFTDFFDIHSPSRLFRDVIGINIVKGIGVGIEEEVPDLEKDIDSNLSDLTRSMVSTVDYETAITTAQVVANRDNIISSIDGNDGNESNANGVPNYIENNIFIDGWKAGKVLTPYISNELASSGKRVR